MKTFPEGTRSVNWYKYNDFQPLQIDDPYAVVATDVAFNTQTSVIKCWYDPLQDVYNIRIAHDGKTLTTTLAGAVREHPEMLDYAYEQFILEWSKDKNSLPVMRQLFNSLFGQFYGAEFAPATPAYATGGWIKTSSLSEKTHSEMSYDDYMKKINLYQKQAMLYQTPYFFDKSSTHYSPAEFKGYNPAADLFAPNSTSQELADKSNSLPGVNEVVRHPVTGNRRTLARTIINLNDEHRWTREQIADWIETLDINITFE